MSINLGQRRAETSMNVRSVCSRNVAVLVSFFLVLLWSRPLAAQMSDVDFGVRGGVFNHGVPIEAEFAEGFGTLFTTDNTNSFTFGPTVGALFNDHWNIRFEAVRTSFRFHSRSNFGLIESTGVTVGHIWQYPLLLTYIVGKGSARPFAGGGVSFGSTLHGTQTITSVGPPAGNPTGPVTSVTTTGPFTNQSDHAFYITGGLDGRVSFLSIRPEIRYGHWVINNSNNSDVAEVTLFSPNQIEFLIGVTLHPQWFWHRH